MSRPPSRPSMKLRCVMLWWIGVVLCLGVMEGLAVAAPVLVIVRTLDATDPAPYELRLRSELAAEGIDAIVANPNTTTGSDFRALATRFGTHAVIDVSVSTSEVATVIWASEPSYSLEVTRQLRSSNLQRDAVSVFALRAVDFLEGARLELEQQRRAKSAASANTTSGGAATGPGVDATKAATTSPQTNRSGGSPEAVRASTARATTPALAANRGATDARAGAALRADRFRIDWSYSLLLPGNEFSWASAPAISFSWEFRSPWVLAASLAGPYINHIEASSGNYRSTVDQELLELEIRRRYALWHRFDIEPYFGLGGSRFAADGRSSRSPLVGHLATAWSLYATAGGCFVWHLGSHLHLVVDMAGFARFQSPKVIAQIGDGGEFTDLTGSSRWNFLAKLGPGWSF